MSVVLLFTIIQSEVPRETSDCALLVFMKNSEIYSPNNLKIVSYHSIASTTSCKDELSNRLSHDLVWVSSL